jgi:lipid-A-disaccharide synthase
MANLQKNKRLLVVTGETSGDHHGAGVVEALLGIDAGIQVSAVGGDALNRAGARLLFHSKHLAVVGVMEVLSKFSHIWRAYQILKQTIAREKPSLLLLIDYPDFNLRVAKLAKRHQVPVLYYISPQIWAWRQGRAKKIARIVDKMAVIFPFEVPFYEQVGLEAHFVGHPLMDQEILMSDPEDAVKRFGLEKKTPIIGLLPGSRPGEVTKLLPDLLDAAVIILREMPDAGFILPLAPGLDRDVVDMLIRSRKIPVTVVEGQFHEAVNVCDLALVVSGTATLETALLAKPMVIIYKVAPLTYTIGRMLVDVESIGLANIVAGKKIVPELIQHEGTPARIAATALKIIKDPELARRMRAELTRVRGMLGEKGAAEQVAKLAYDMMNTD